MVPVPDDQHEGQEGRRWKRVASKNGCMIPQDPDAPPREDALHNYCRLDILEKMCCSAFKKERVRCAFKAISMHHDGM